MRKDEKDITEEDKKEAKRRIQGSMGQETPEDGLSGDDSGNSSPPPEPHPAIEAAH